MKRRFVGRLLSQTLNTVVKVFWQIKKTMQIFNKKNAIDFIL